MHDERSPDEIIAAHVAERARLRDDEVVAELMELTPLPDEDDDAYESKSTWAHVYVFVALADVAAIRKLRPAARLLLQRASYAARELAHGCGAFASLEHCVIARRSMPCARCSTTKPTSSATKQSALSR